MRLGAETGARQAAREHASSGPVPISIVVARAFALAAADEGESSYIGRRAGFCAGKTGGRVMYGRRLLRKGFGGIGGWPGAVMDSAFGAVA